MIPTTDWPCRPNIDGTPNPNGIHYSQPDQRLLQLLPFDDYNKYDTNEMYLGYGRANLFHGSENDGAKYNLV